MENGNTYSAYRSKAAAVEFSGVIHLYSSSILTAESEHISSGHMPFLWGNRFHNPAYALNRFSDFFWHLLTLYRVDAKSMDLNILIFTSVSTGVKYLVLLIYFNLSVAFSELFTENGNKRGGERIRQVKESC